MDCLNALKKYKSVIRLILNAHGREGLVGVKEGMDAILPPKFTNSYFPNLEILHVLSCQAGKLDYKYGSELKKGQIAFVHAGHEVMKAVIMEQTLSNLILPEPKQFLFLNPISIIHKTKSGTVTLAKIKQLPIEEIQRVVNEKEGLFQSLKRKASQLLSSAPDVGGKIAGGKVLSESQEDKITRLYDIITDYTKTNKDKIMELFASAEKKTQRYN